MADLDLGLRLDGSPFTVPIDAAAARYVVLGKSGAGKTNAGAVMVEEFVRAGVPTIVLDPLGNCWGLRSSADGEGAGLPMVIFGGSRGDVPLSFQRVEYVADLLAEGVSAVLDFSLMPSEEMVDFAYHFLPRLLQRATMNLHVVFEEADRFAPQRAVSSPVTTWSRAARNGGIGWTFSTQKPQVLHKEVIDSANVFVGMRMTGELAQDAVGGEIGSRIGKKSAKHMMSELSTFARGDAWFVPEGDWLGPDAPEGEPERIRFRLRSTFEVRPPRVGEQRREPKMLADVDLERVRRAMAADDEEDEDHVCCEHAYRAEDQLDREVPELRARIEELERDLDAAGDKWREERKQLGAIVGDTWVSLKVALSHLRTANDHLEPALGYFKNATASDPATAEPPIKRAQENPPEITVSAPVPVRTPDPAPIKRALENPSEFRERATTSVPDGLPKGPASLVTMLARLGGRTSKIRLKVLCGFKTRTLSDYLSALRSRGLIVDDGPQNVSITDAGRAFAGDVGPPPTTKELLEIYAVLPGGVRAILHILVAKYPQSVEKASLGRQFGFSTRTLSDYLSRLRSLSLAVDTSPTQIRASHDLFPTEKS